MTDIKQRDSKIRNELTRLALEHGGELQPRAVVDAARAEDSPLHDSFDWNDTSAAEKFRLAQARSLIRAVVTYEELGNKLIESRVFVSLTSDRDTDGAGYRLTTNVMSDDVQRQQMLTDAMVEMQRFKEKYRRLTELAKVFAAMEDVEVEASPQAVRA